MSTWVNLCHECKRYKFVFGASHWSWRSPAQSAWCGAEAWFVLRAQSNKWAKWDDEKLVYTPIKTSTWIICKWITWKPVAMLKETFRQLTLLKIVIIGIGFLTNCDTVRKMFQTFNHFLLSNNSPHDQYGQMRINDSLSSPLAGKKRNSLVLW